MCLDAKNSIEVFDVFEYQKNIHETHAGHYLQPEMTQVMKYLEFVVMWRCIQDARLIGSLKSRWNQEIARLPNGFLPFVTSGHCRPICVAFFATKNFTSGNGFSLGIFRITIGLSHGCRHCHCTLMFWMVYVLVACKYIMIYTLYIFMNMHIYIYFSFSSNTFVTD